MPELPDVTVYQERLVAVLGGQRLLDVRIRSPFLLRSVAPPITELVGRTLQQVERLGKLANLPTAGAGTAFRSLKSTLTFGGGQLRTDGLQIETPEFSVTGQGRLQLVEPMRMDYSVLTQLSPDLTRRILSSSSVTGGQGTVGRLVSSFFVEKDSLVIPLQVTGPLQQPTFGIDAAVLRKRARTNLFDNLRQRVLGGAVDAPGQPKEPPPSPEKREPGVKETLREILERIRKKPPEKP